jgi:hypothetical protein
MKLTWSRLITVLSLIFVIFDGLAADASTVSTEVIVSVPDQVLALVDRAGISSRVIPFRPPNLESAIRPAVTARRWALCSFRQSLVTDCLQVQSLKIGFRQEKSLVWTLRAGTRSSPASFGCAAWKRKTAAHAIVASTFMAHLRSAALANQPVSVASVCVRAM